MNSLKTQFIPSKVEQKVAQESFHVLEGVLNQIHTKNPEIKIEASTEKIKIPLEVLKQLATILKETGQGKSVSLVSVKNNLTTQSAAELLGCSRPHLIKLLEEGKIEFSKIGNHRRIKYEDVMAYRKKSKEQQKKLLINIMSADEESGLYDT